MRIVVDGNDGTGKTTLVAGLRAHGLEAVDRGLPTRMTDDRALEPRDDEFYLLLDAPIEVCRARLQRAGKDLDEQYHTEADLLHYRQRFLEVARLLPHHVVVDADGSAEAVLARCLEALQQAGLR